MTGSIDFAFEYEGRVWFGDWKTNSLPDYTPETVAQSVGAAYDGQIRIYTLALMRACGIATREQYERRFGGAVYVYLRGFDGAGSGIHSARPTWEQLQELDVLLKAAGKAEWSTPPNASDAMTDDTTKDDDDSEVFAP
jgi:exodeoxyribonuclease V beta subunit